MNVDQDQSELRMKTSEQKSRALDWRRGKVEDSFFGFEGLLD